MMNTYPLHMKDNEKSRNRILATAGLKTARFKIFVVIATHPAGISIPHIGERLKLSGPRVTYHINKLEHDTLVHSKYEKRNGNVERFCYATVFGVHTILGELESLLTLFTAIEKEALEKRTHVVGFGGGKKK